MEIRPYRDEDFSGVKALWEEAFPHDPPANRAEIAIPAKLAVQGELLFVACDSEFVAGTVMAGYDGHRGWLYSVAVRGDSRRSGLGTRLVRHAEQALLAMDCAKINLQVRSTNAAVVAFYEALGYAVEDRISLGKRF
ncbi:GNAT family acetyltransferase [Novosphingobium sp. YAF33]|uniref:GNAT family acetyltransferase n=1 Tax=Novosphingobium sp. YAF33 TaxID=3233082 RepID=UPI003F94AA52